MSYSPEEIRDVLDQLCTELPFDPAEETSAEIEATVLEMVSLFNSLREHPSETDSVGHLSDDEYNALLDVYDQPRTTTTEGPLAGLTFAVKDNIMAQGLSTTCGSRQFSFVPAYDSTVVERLLSNGAAMVGKNNMEPFAMGPTGDHSEFGRVENPSYAGCISGGSSSGSGASVAGDLVDVALGTDTGGSVRIPAACCGVVGVKPTRGLVPLYGFVDYVPSTDTIGPIAGDVETASRVMEAIAGRDPRDPSSVRTDGSILDRDLSMLDGETVGVLTPFTDRAETDVRDSLYDVATRLDDSSGVSVDELTVEFSGPEMFNLYSFLATEFVWFLRQSGVLRGKASGFNEEWRAAFESYLETTTLSDYMASRMLPGEVVDRLTDGEAYTAVRNAITTFEYELLELFEDVDALLMPTLPILPPQYAEVDEMDTLYALAVNTAPFSLVGNPAITVPVAERSGLPVSAQVVSPFFEDGVGFRVAKRIESLVNGEMDVVD